MLKVLCEAISGRPIGSFRMETVHAKERIRDWWGETLNEPKFQTGEGGRSFSSNVWSIT